MSVGESTGNFLIKHGGVRVVVGLTCSLSIIGSVLIILSYVCFKNMRSRAREILMHISLMDLGVGLANLIGDAVSFDRYYKHDDINVTMTGVVLNISVEPYIDRLCRTQAFFAVYFTYGSVLWTISLAVYLYFLIIHHGTQTALYFIRFAYVFSYSMPLVMALWLMLTKRLGYAPYNSSGWCALIMTDPATKQHHLLTAIFGYDMWIYLAIVLVPTLYITVRVYIHDQVREAQPYVTSERFWGALNNVDYKFLSIPVIFITLRVWTCISNILYVYIGYDWKEIPQTVNHILIYLSGIGDSGQGFANAVLFILFTRRVRTSFMSCIVCCRKQKDRSDDINPRRSHPATQDHNTPLLQDTSESGTVQ